MKNNKGFSLVELIVVIAIMAILAAVAIVSFSIYIKRANEAADLEYETNLRYAAQLVATDHQFELEDVHHNDVVAGPQDIWLSVKGEDDPYTYTSHPDIIEEIYKIVGDWTFSYACDHANCTIEDEDPATCQKDGLITYSCGATVVVRMDPTAHDFSNQVWSADQTTFTARCKNKVIVGTAPDGSAIEEQCPARASGYKDENGFPVISAIKSRED